MSSSAISIWLEVARPLGLRNAVKPTEFPGIIRCKRFQRWCLRCATSKSVSWCLLSCKDCISVWIWRWVFSRYSSNSALNAAEPIVSGLPAPSLRMSSLEAIWCALKSSLRRVKAIKEPMIAILSSKHRGDMLWSCLLVIFPAWRAHDLKSKSQSNGLPLTRSCWRQSHFHSQISWKFFAKQGWRTSQEGIRCIRECFSAALIPKRTG